MKIRNKFFLIILSIFILLSSITIIYFEYSNNQNLKQLENYGNILNGLIKTSINSYNKTYESLVSDYSFWDDMVDYVNGKKNKVWEVENLYILFKSYGINAVWVYDKDKNIKFFVDNFRNDTSFYDIGLSDFDWKEFKENRGISFQKKIKDKYCFIFGKTIHPSYDFERKSEPEGYFIIAKTLDNDMLNYCYSICGCELKIIEDSILPDYYNLVDATYTSSYPFNNNNGELIGSLRATKKSLFLEKLHKQSVYTIVFLSFLTLFVLCVIYYGFDILVNRPLKLLNQAIIDKSDEKINKLTIKNNEFGKFGLLLKEFINKNKLLENEVAKRKKADESINELNKMYKSIFDDSSVAICFSLEQKLINVNNAFLELFKYNSFEELKDIEIIDLICEEDKSILFERYKRAEMGLINENSYDVRIKCSDGEIRDVNVKSNVIELNDKKYNLTILLDFTDKKRFEKELLKEKAYFENIFEKSPEAIAILDNKGVIIKINNAFTKLFGYTAEEAIGKKTKELIEPKEIFGEINSLISRVVMGETIFYDTVRVTKNGEIINVSIIGTPIEYYKNKFGIYAIYHDISDRVKYNKEIKLKGELFNALSKAQQQLLNIKSNDNSLQLYIKTIGEALQIDRIRVFDIFYNAQDGNKIKTLSEWKNNEHILSLPEIGDDELLSIFNNWIEKFDSIKIYDKESNNLNSKDSEILLKCGIKALVAAPIYTRDKLSAFICFEDFVNDNKWTETEISILNISASSIGNFLESRLYEIELIKSREKAEEADKLKTNFISNISHELRTPLNGILGFTELLKEELVNEEHKNMLEIINLSSLRLLDTLNSIIDFTLLSKLKIYLNKTVVDIDEVINNKIKIFKIDLERKGIRFYYQSNNKIKILTDYDYFGRIFGNLIDNAIKFTKKGAIVIDVRLIQNESGVNFAQIKVIDTGIGIAKEHFELIFEPFRQVSEGLSREYEGNGLGLTICKRYVDLLGGKIEVSSELGKGTTFTLTFPDVISSITYNDSEIKIKKNNPLILLVEDEISSREFANFILSGKYSLHTAINADNAIKKIYEYKYDAILMDISLGMGKNGVDVANIIRSVSGYENVPIAAVTANAMIDQIEHYMKSGFTHYIAKPYTKEALLSLIEQMLNKIL